MPFTFSPLRINGVVLVDSRTFPDERGWFREGFRSDDFFDAGLPDHFVQDNCSYSTRGVLRGLHFQHHPKPQGKLVSVAHGEIFDVAVDLRVSSPTFGAWIGEVLSSENGRALWIPEGFGHGFCVLSEGAVVTYKCTNPFDPKLDAGVRFDDPAIGVEWPGSDWVLSEKDRELPLLGDIDRLF